MRRVLFVWRNTCPTAYTRVWEKYYGFTPWQYSFNNLLGFKDVNGKAAVAAVEEKEKEITIKAVYLVSVGYSASDIAEMASSINGFLNSQNYKVSKGEYSGYDVKFDLSVIDPEADGNFKTIEDFNYGGYPIGNEIMKGTEREFDGLVTKLQDRLKGKHTGGVTEDHKSIKMHEKRDTFRNRLHEILHTCFFDNDDAANGIGSYEKQDMPNQDDINNLINNPSLPKIPE